MLLIFWCSWKSGLYLWLWCFVCFQWLFSKCFVALNQCLDYFLSVENCCRRVTSRAILAHHFVSWFLIGYYSLCWQISVSFSFVSESRWCFRHWRRCWLDELVLRQVRWRESLALLIRQWRKVLGPLRACRCRRARREAKRCAGDCAFDTCKNLSNFKPEMTVACSIIGWTSTGGLISAGVLWDCLTGHWWSCC